MCAARWGFKCLHVLLERQCLVFPCWECKQCDSHLTSEPRPEASSHQPLSEQSPSPLRGSKAWHVRLCLCVQCPVSIRVYWQNKQSLIPSFLREVFSCGSVGVWPPVAEIITRSSEARPQFCPLTSLHICDYWRINKRHSFHSKAHQPCIISQMYIPLVGLCLRNATHGVIYKDRRGSSSYDYTLRSGA